MTVRITIYDRISSHSRERFPVSRSKIVKRKFFPKIYVKRRYDSEEEGRGDGGGEGQRRGKQKEVGSLCTWEKRAAATKLTVIAYCTA